MANLSNPNYWTTEREEELFLIFGSCIDNNEIKDNLEDYIKLNLDNYHKINEKEYYLRLGGLFEKYIKSDIFRLFGKPPNKEESYLCLNSDLIKLYKKYKDLYK